MCYSIWKNEDFRVLAAFIIYYNLFHGFYRYKILFYWIRRLITAFSNIKQEINRSYHMKKDLRSYNTYIHVQNYEIFQVLLIISRTIWQNWIKLDTYVESNVLKRKKWTVIMITRDRAQNHQSYIEPKIGLIKCIFPSDNCIAFTTRQNHTENQAIYGSMHCHK